MARPKETTGQILAELTDELQCAICNDQLKKPKYLQCHHSYCEECLQQLAKIPTGRRQRDIVCPLCREKTRVPRKGVAGFKTNVMALNLLDKITSKEVASESKGRDGTKLLSSSITSRGKCFCFCFCFWFCFGFGFGFVLFCLFVCLFFFCKLFSLLCIRTL